MDATNENNRNSVSKGEYEDRLILLCVHKEVIKLGCVFGSKYFSNKNELYAPEVSISTEATGIFMW